MLPRALAFLAMTSIVLAACGGGGGGSSVPAATATATPTPGAASASVTTATGGASAPASYTVGSYVDTSVFPAASAAAQLSTTFSTTQPSGTATIQSLARRPQNIGAASISPIAFLCFTSSASITLNGLPSFALTVPSALASAANYTYVALYNPTNASAGWTTVAGPASVNGSVFNIAATTTAQPITAGQTYCLMIFTLTSLLATPAPTTTATPTAAPGASNDSAFTCPQSDQSLDSVTRTAAAGVTSRTRRSGALNVTRSASPAANLLAVTYSASSLASSTASALASSREGATGASLVQTLSFAHTGKVVHVLAVPAGQAAVIAAQLRTQSGVVSVAPTGARRSPFTVSTPYYPTDPYFNGFSTTVAPTAGATLPPSTYHVGPYDESASVPGQWDMHAIKLEDAFAYGGQRLNGSGIYNAAALGSSSVKIAIIDTGEDPTHPELTGKIAYQKCYITNAAGTAQSTSNYETDPLGHGTDVAGIAAAATNNAFGFAGAGGNASIYAYRVFPTPDDTCANDNSTSDQCGASTVDIASAITDAIAQKVNVISMSLGGDTCGTGSGYAANGDSDMTEGQAVAEAIAAGIVVVAAAGNSGTSGVAAPACDTGVIAVGATSLADGSANANGSGVTGGSAASPIEYVATYSQYGTVNTYQSSASWGIVAPGGDPSTDTDNDDLHWIENIWTSTPFKANSSDTTYEGECDDDYPNSSGTTPPLDCRTLIAGTSMSTPHVAGAAALIIAVNPSYQSPTAMKQLLCATADQLTLNAKYEGCGRLNVYRAMATAVGDTALP